jgi:Fur family transcriptional regulator, ferric uptake regulator
VQSRALIAHLAIDRSNPDAEQDGERKDDGRVAEREEEANAEWPLAFTHEFPGGVVDGSDVVGVKGMTHPKSQGKNSCTETEYVGLGESIVVRDRGKEQNEAENEESADEQEHPANAHPLIRTERAVEIFEPTLHSCQRAGSERNSTIQHCRKCKQIASTFEMQESCGGILTAVTKPVASAAPVSDVSSVDGVLELVRSRGGRATPSRRLLLEVLFQSDGHLSAEDLAQAVQQRAPDVHISTIYRNLEELEHLGIIVHSHLGHGPATYQLASLAHAHFICESCGTTIEAPDALFRGLARAAKEKLGFTIDPHHFAILGRCDNCT